MTKKFSKRQQLEDLIKKYPRYNVDIQGVILDFASETGTPLDEILSMRTQIYKDIFMDKKKQSQAVALLKSLLLDDESVKTLSENCKNIFPLVTDRINDISTRTKQYIYNNIIDNLSSICRNDLSGFPVDVTIWQLSDIHFGRYNKFDNKPREMAAILGQSIIDFPVMTPDLIVITGDLTSVAKSNEFELFVDFCNALSEFLWDETKNNETIRFMVVPGNHDIAWKPDGRADKFKIFQECLKSEKKIITPFSPEGTYPLGSGGNVTIHHSQTGEEPPVAIAELLDYGIQLILLISSYYSGLIPEKTMELMSDDAMDNMEQDFKDILREDKGLISKEYIMNIANLLKKKNSENGKFRIGVTHHNLCQFGVETCLNPNSPFLLKTLSNWGAFLVLHGHVHLREKPPCNRPRVPDSAYPIPCSTFSSIPVSGGNSFNIHFVGKQGAVKRMSTFSWDCDNNHSYTEKSLQKLYQFQVEDQNVEITDDRDSCKT